MSAFGVKLGLYKIMGDNPKDVSISFDGVEVAIGTVTSTDVDNPDFVEFTVDKAKGVYQCEMATTSNIGDGESIGITTIYVKPLDESPLYPDQWYDLRIYSTNPDESKVFPDVAESSWKTSAASYYDEPVTLNIQVEGAAFGPGGAYGYYRFPSPEAKIAEWTRRLESRKDNEGGDLSQDNIDWMTNDLAHLNSIVAILNDPEVRY